MTTVHNKNSKAHWKITPGNKVLYVWCFKSDPQRFLHCKLWNKINSLSFKKKEKIFSIKFLFYLPVGKRGGAGAGIGGGAPGRPPGPGWPLGAPTPGGRVKKVSG